ncbi:2OG-Fe(II) oxygenase [Streptomyces griseoloalbus]|uniref:2OG-Fe(II) oxygenase n=1 Tax=Streptomyces griseoloalbus TaxID=67303 RepID=UPI0033B58AD1
MTTTVDNAPFDYDALARTEPATDPFRWALVRGMLPGAVGTRLAEEFPTEGFTLTERATGTGGKGYSTRNLKLVERSEPVPAALALLTPRWRAVVDALLSPRYRAAVAALSGRDLTGCTVEARAVRYGAGSWIDPHTDRADKAVTQTWYFNSGWLPEWGGALCILAGPNGDEVVRQVRPDLGESVVLVPSEASWHSVAAVTDEARQERQTLLVHFVRPEAAG